MMIDSDARRSGDPTARLILCVIVAIVGLWLLGFGAWLAVLGGSIYYVLAGIALLGSAWLLFRGRSAGLFVNRVASHECTRCLRRSADRNHGVGAVGSWLRLLATGAAR